MLLEKENRQIKKMEVIKAMEWEEMMNLPGGVEGRTGVLISSKREA